VDANRIAERIMETRLQRIIIAGDSPGRVKDLFVRAMIISGNDPKDVVLASFRDNGAIYRSDTELAKAILLCSLYGLFYEEAAKPGENPVNVDTLIIGGGIAGIQASLEIANSGNKVFLVEKSGTIGGHMATFDKTFPTLDCAACILTPKMVEVGQHPNIELMTCSEIVGVSGIPGNYKVTIFRKARYVNLEKCTGCGICATKCPTSVPSEFDSGTTLRKAIYIPFPQAVPNKYLVDAAHCRYIQEGKCGVCVKSCPVEDCINLDAKDETVEFTVGNIILATGFEPFDASRIEDYGYGEYPNVVTSLEFERLVNASGPTGGNITLRTRDKKGNWIFTPDSDEPESIAIIHCVGSRDRNHNAYCSRVCCMYSLKLAHLVKEKLPDARVSEYYIDMRAFGKGYEEFYNRIKREGVNIIRGCPGKIEEIDGKLLVRSEDILNDALIEDKVDMVVLSVGLEPGVDSDKLSNMLGVPTSEDGWFMEANNIFDPVNTRAGGITLAGVCQGPKDIPSTVAQASAAASRVLQSIVRQKVQKNAADLSLKKIEKNIQQLSNIKMVCYERVN
jgi:heterodisulfide reductase subunit A